MASKTIYKKISLAQSLTRTMTPLTPEKKVKTHAIVTKFIQYLKNAHS
jgi:hypothetical protein